MTKDLADLVKGDAVCKTGLGVRSPVHRHGVVKRITQIYIVVDFTNSHTAYEERFRRVDGRSVPYDSQYSSYLHATCFRVTRPQQPDPEKRAEVDGGSWAAGPNSDVQRVVLGLPALGTSEPE